jgi:DNA-binding HxlR family transcriptional regulator
MNANMNGYTPITETNFSTRTKNNLIKNGITVLWQLNTLGKTAALKLMTTQKSRDEVTNYFIEKSRIENPTTTTAAQRERQKNIDYYDGIDFRVKPTKGIDSGAGGKKHELVLTPNDSRKTKVAKQGRADVFIRFDGVTRKIPVEIKTNGGQITSLLNSIRERGDNLIIYELDIKNKNTGYIRRHVSDRIMTINTFLQGLEESGAIRRNKKTTQGGTCAAIESSASDWARWLEEQLEYDRERIYELDEIV